MPGLKLELQSKCHEDVLAGANSSAVSLPAILLSEGFIANDILSLYSPALSSRDLLMGKWFLSLVLERLRTITIKDHKMCCLSIVVVVVIAVRENAFNHGSPIKHHGDQSI